MQVLPFITLLTLGFRKVASVVATAAAVELLRVMVVVVIFVRVSHFCAQKAENENTYKMYHIQPVNSLAQRLRLIRAA
jgi:uncharacterized membrane protein AbrB (regulator of aidB expression)